MAVHFRRLSLNDFFKLVLPLGAVVILGVAVRLWYPCSWWPHDLMRPLADAFIVAGTIGLGLELVATKFLIERVANDLSEKLVGRGLPTELQGHIRNIVNTALVRDHYVKTYRFSKIAKGRVKIEMEITFDVSNYSDSAIDYVPEMDQEAAFKPDFLYLEYKLRGDLSHVLGKDQLAGRVEDKHPPNTATRLVKGDKSVRLKPILENPESVCTVLWKLAVVMPEEFSDTTEFRNATIDATLRLAEDMPAGLKFESSGDNAPSGMSWHFNGPFVTGQAIRAQWLRPQSEDVVKAGERIT
jgi:hypothetical protein